MKNKKNVDLLLIGMIIFMTLIMLAMNGYCVNNATANAYQQQQNFMSANEKNSYANDNDEFLRQECGNWIIPIYLKYTNDDKSSYGELLIENYDELTRNEKDIAESALSNVMYQFDVEYANIDYYLEDNNALKTKDSDTTTSSKEDTTITQHQTQSTIFTNNSQLSNYLDTQKTIPDNDDWYVAFSFDEEGTLFIERAENNLKLSSIESGYKNTKQNILNEIATDYGRTVKFKKLTNLTFVFAVSSDSGIGYNYEEQGNEIYNAVYHEHLIINYRMVYFLGITLMIILSIMIPKTSYKESKFFNMLRDIPLEVGIFIFAFCFISSSFNVYPHFIENASIWALGMDCFCYIASFTFLMYVIGLMKISEPKHRKEALLEAGLLFNPKHNVKQKFKDFYHYLNDMDLTDESNKRILILILLNLVLLLLFGQFGLFFFLPYCTVLCIIFTRKHKKYIKEFNTVKTITSRISNGDYKDPIDTELGVYEPLKDDLASIQQGIEEAVAKEMISQRMKSELITNVSHDLKTPLTAIISYIDLLKGENITEEERKSYLITLEKSADRLKHLIEDLFEISKANSGNVSLDFMEVDLISLLKQVEMECKHSLDDKRLILKHQFSDEKILIQLDPQKACRIFENLISNVSKYALEGTRVFLSVIDYESRVDIEIKNVSKDELDFTPEEIVERFTRGDKSRNTDGSGLGLAIAKSFTELMNGKMQIIIDGDVFKVLISFYNKQKEA
ncbi:sensor histidine kinase [[Eubacterium] hominis]|uniref:sensor histidine kinase n=1 Tax=[Eubacterium] hominis TaxID=2764325 RepID=UPI003A4D2126